MRQRMDLTKSGSPIDGTMRWSQEARYERGLARLAARTATISGSVRIAAFRSGNLPLFIFSKQAFAVIHCTMGDAMIARLSLLNALAVFGRTGWPGNSARPVWIAVVTLGIGYTIYSELL